MAALAGTIQITANGVVAGSGKRIRVYDIIARSTSGGASVVTVYNGTSSGGTVYDILNISAASTTLVRSFGQGMLLPAGCYITVDSNTSFVTVNCVQEG